jgi:class 3 adenylate cyclase
VDVNIAARVGECAKAGEVLVSDPARAAMDDGGFKFGRRRRLRESGAPRDLSVHTVTAA